jgi:hypothetical protein
MTFAGQTPAPFNLTRRGDGFDTGMVANAITPIIWAAWPTYRLAFAEALEHSPAGVVRFVEVQHLLR